MEILNPKDHIENIASQEGNIKWLQPEMKIMNPEGQA